MLCGSFSKLGERDGALKLAHPRVQRREVVIRVLVAVTPSLVDEETHAAPELGIVGDDHAAFTGGDVLALLQAEAADGAERADGAAIIGGAIGLRAVFDNGEAVSRGELQDRAHLGRIAEQVGDDDGAGLWAQDALDRFRRHVAGPWVDIRKNRDRGLVDDRCDGPHISDGRRHDLVARRRVDGGDRGVDRGRAGRAGRGMGHAHQRGEVGYEALDEGALRAGERAAADGLGYERDLLVAEEPPACVLIRRNGRHRRFVPVGCVHRDLANPATCLAVTEMPLADHPDTCDGDFEEKLKMSGDHFDYLEF